MGKRKNERYREKRKNNIRMFFGKASEVRSFKPRQQLEWNMGLY